MRNKLVLVGSIAMISLTGCLQTRSEIRKDSPSTGGKVTSSPIVFATKERELSKEAQADNRFEEVNKDFRQLYGRVETMENQMSQIKDNKALETQIKSLETKIALLETTVADLNNRAKKEPVKEAASDKKKEDKDELASANKYYEEKKWEEAILAYEDYRKQNPKSKHYAEATFKIGVSFQSLGMKDDAKAFYKEVVDKFPASKEAGLAKSKLKKI